jgi:hypothetical protein
MSYKANNGYKSAYNVGLSLSGKTISVPSPTAGQTLVWRAGFASTATINSDSPSNFSSVTGAGYSDKIGPRFGTDINDPAFQSPGWSMRVPRNPTPGSGTVFLGAKDIVPTSALGACGMACGTIKIAGTTAGAYSNVARMIGFSINPTAPLFGFAVKQTTFGLPGLTLAKWDSGVGISGETVAGNINQWIYFQLAWQYIGGNFLERVYYKLLNDTGLTQLGTQLSVAFDLRPVHLNLQAVYGDIVSIDPWYGTVGGLSLYSCPDIETASLYPNDIILPANDNYIWGVGTGQHFPTADDLVTGLSRGIVLGDYRGWVDSAGASADLSTLSTRDDAIIWRDAYRAGNRNTTGNVIEIREPNLYCGSRIMLEQAYGITLRGASGGSLTIMRDIGNSFTQPNAGSYPNVWQILGSTYGGLVGEAIPNCGVIGYENTRLMNPQFGANLAAVISALNTIPGACYADGSGFYFSTFSGSDPNSDGMIRRVSTVLEGPNGTGSGVVAAGTTLVKNLTIEAGPICIYTDGSSTPPQYVRSIALNNLSVADNVIHLQGCYHSSGLVGNDIAGAQFEFDTTHERMWTGGGAITLVAYTAITDTQCRIFSVFDNVINHSAQSSGQEASSFIGIQSWYQHSLAGRTLPAFCTIFTNCDLCGVVNEQLNNDEEFSFDDSICQYIIGASNGSKATGCTFLTPWSTSYLGDLTLTNCTVTYNSGYGTGSPGLLQAELNIVGGSIDISNFGFSGGAVWSKNGTFNFTMTNCTITGTGSLISLITGASNTDTILLSNCTFNGGLNQILLMNYNDGLTTSNRTITEAIALGIVI